MIPHEFKCIRRHPEEQDMVSGTQHSGDFLEDSVREEGFWPWLITKGYLQLNAVGRKKEQQESLHTCEKG